MVNPLVARATNDVLVGPDWAKNAEICDILIHDPGQVKDVVKGVRRRIVSKNAKIQILALTLLETLMNNCGDFVHMHVAERGVLRKMMRIAKKKRNYHVKEKVLMLLDNWQEAFGGPGSRHPQYHDAFNTLLHAGVIFPRRSDRRAPVFAPLQNQPYPPYLRSPDHKQDIASEEPEFPTLSLAEIQNARGIVDVLAEMLNGLEPGNEESLRQDSTIELVQQCRTYKQRVVHLINSTSDESLLSQGLALNDDLQRLLAKHEAIASGANSGELVPKPLQALVDIGDLVTNEDQNKQSVEKTSCSDPANQPSIDLLLPASSPTDVSPTPSTKPDTGIDLLSWDDIIISSEPENFLALVPGTEPEQESNPNDIGLPQNNVAASSFDSQSACPNELQYEQNLQGPYNMDLVQYQQQPNQHLVNGTEGGSNFPPPPWETQAAADNQQPKHLHYTHGMQITQVGATHPHPMNNMIYSHQITTLQGSTMVGMFQHGEQAYYQTPQNNQFQGYGSQSQNNQFQGYGSQPQYLDQRMYTLTMTSSTTPYQASTPSNYMQPSMRPKPEDKLFGDLVSMAKAKPQNSSADTPASA